MKLRYKKLAQENARYMISSFTPTTMGHSLDFKQLNYTMNWFENFMKDESSNGYDEKLKESMKEFNEQFDILREEKLNESHKQEEFKFYDDEPFQEHFGTTYSTSYKASVAELAQAQRHRSIDYTVEPLVDGEIEYYVPKLIENDENLKAEWLINLKSVEYDYPQATMFKVKEKGTWRMFLKKAQERLCGHAQDAVMRTTYNTMEEYAEGTKDTFPELYDIVVEYTGKAKCQFPDGVCTGTCPYGPNEGVERDL